MQTSIWCSLSNWYLSAASMFINILILFCTLYFGMLITLIIKQNITINVNYTAIELVVESYQKKYVFIFKLVSTDT